MHKIPLSVVVITKNEEQNIDRCLKSADFADEIVVVDDYSSDKTVELAGKYTNKIVQRKMDIEGAHRNYAYSLSKNKWVLSLDADECISEELKNEIEETLSKETPHVVFSIPIKTYIGNRWIQYGGWYPAGKDRLFLKDKFKYEEAGVHPRPIYKGTCGHLTKDIVHYSYNDFHDFFISLNNQTTLEAKKWIQDKRKINFSKILYKMFERFFKSFFLKKGYKDGVLGFMVCYSGSLYQLYTYVKYWEMKNNINS